MLARRVSVLPFPLKAGGGNVVAYNDYVVTGLVSTEPVAVMNPTVVTNAFDFNFSQYAGISMVAAMGYVLVIEKNVALFAVLFLMLSLFYNPTKFTMNGKLYNDSDIIL